MLQISPAGLVFLAGDIDARARPVGRAMEPVRPLTGLPGSAMTRALVRLAATWRMELDIEAAALHSLAAGARRLADAVTGADADLAGILARAGIRGAR